MNNVSAYGRLLYRVNKSRESERQTDKQSNRQTDTQIETDGRTNIDLCVGYAVPKHVLTLCIPSIARTFTTHTHTHTHTHLSLIHISEPTRQS